MASPLHAITPSGFQGNIGATFIAANSTVAKLIIDGSLYPASAATSTAPTCYGGGTIIDLVANSAEPSASKDIVFYGGVIATTQGGSTGAMATTATSNGTITRSTGSFLTDGWFVGDLAMLFAPYGTAPNAAVDGILCNITSVTALTLTINGVPIAALSLATGTRICRVTPEFRATVAAGAGTSGALRGIPLLGSSFDGSLIRTEKKFSSTEIYAAAMQSAASALPAYISINGQVAKY